MTVLIFEVIMDAVTSASVVMIACDITLQWDCNLPMMFERIDRIRFMNNIIIPTLTLIYNMSVIIIPLWLMKRLGSLA